MHLRSLFFADVELCSLYTSPAIMAISYLAQSLVTVIVGLNLGFR